MKSYFKIPIAVLILLFSGCKILKNNKTETYKTGKVSIKEIKHTKWFKNEFKTYHPNPTIIDSLSPLNSYTLVIIGGEWCSDTRMQLPRFTKILEILNIPIEKTTLYLVDRNKECANCGDYSKQKYQIKLIPTFILIDKNGNEKGRIIESPKKTLEEDLLRILTQH